MVVEAPPRARTHVVAALVVAAVIAQVVYPLVRGSARDTLTLVIVALVATSALLHAAITYGTHAAIVVVTATVLGGFAVEVLGVHTGFPFGRYAYSSSLGPRGFGVPLVIAFAWPMLAWPAALAARRLCASFPTRVATGAWALAAWDLFLDPQMVAAGHWHWIDRAHHLPGVPSVPLSDYAGWLAVSVLMSIALQTALRRGADADDRWPLGFYVWTWASSALALAAFLDLPAAALWGALAMGTVAVPLLRSLVSRG